MTKVLTIINHHDSRIRRFATRLWFAWTAARLIFASQGFALVTVKAVKCGFCDNDHPAVNDIFIRRNEFNIEEANTAFLNGIMRGVALSQRGTMHAGGAFAPSEKGGNHAVN